MAPRLRAIVTAGGTSEPIDDVRMVTNTSTGRFGAAIARSLHWQGVDVTVVGSHRMLAHADWLPEGVRRVSYGSTDDLVRVLHAEIARGVDILFMAAAVSDYTPQATDGKLSSAASDMTIHMHRTPKILPTLRGLCGPAATLVGFKLLSGVTPNKLVAVAQAQREANQLSLTVANDLQDLTATDHPAWIVGAQCTRVVGSRQSVADAVVHATLASHGTRPEPLAIGPAVDGPTSGRARRWWHVAEARCEPADHAANPNEALARWRHTPHVPVAIPSPEGLWVGCADEDLRCWYDAWTRAHDRAHRATSGAPPFTAWYRGTPAAVISVDAKGTHTLVSTGLVDDAIWPQPVLESRDVEASAWSVLAEDEAHWIAHGFAACGLAEGARVPVQPPWRRTSPRAAASTCLVHVPSRRVLVGERQHEPARDAIAFPGGHVRGTESAVAASRRELREETGLSAPDATPWFHTRVFGGTTPQWAITCHVWRVAQQVAPTPSVEFHAAWRPIDEVRRDARTVPGVRQVLDMLQDRLDRT